MHSDSLLCVVEIPRGGRNTYEHDPKLGSIKLDRFISAAVVLRKEIGHSFEIHKDLDPDRCSEVIGWDNRVVAFEAIDTARRAFRENGGY